MSEHITPFEMSPIRPAKIEPMDIPMSPGVIAFRRACFTLMGILIAGLVCAAAWSRIVVIQDSAPPPGGASSAPNNITGTVGAEATVSGTEFTR